MEFIDKVKEEAKKNKKTIILPEIDDRIIIAGLNIAAKNIANIVFLGNKEELEEKINEKIKENFKNKDELENKIFKNIKIIDYLSKENESEFEKLSNKLYLLRKEKGLSLEGARKLLKNEIYYAVMLLKEGCVDGMVAGGVYPTKDILKPALQIIKTKKDSKIVSSFFIIDTKNKEFGEDGIIFMSDCGLNINPNSNELSNIALDTSISFKNILNKEPRLAFLSFSSFGSASSESTEKVKEALNITKEKNQNLKCDGEMQLDTAIIKKVAIKKAKSQEVAGCANILIFPDLDSGNIGYKMAQYMSKGKAYGPLLQGIAKPINDLSRGASIEEIEGLALKYL